MTPPPSLQELIETVRQDSPSASPLDLLVTASATVSQLEDLNDALLEHFVSGCRREGKSWSEISAALGVSKQAVHKRFSGPIADRIISRVTSTGTPTLERFTIRARAVLQAAVQAARARGGAEVDAGDLLAGLFRAPEGVAAQVLAAMGVTADAVRAARPPAATPPTPAPAAPADQAAPTDQATTADQAAATGATRPPFAPDAVTALRDALAEALELSHNYIGTEHILLGLMRDPDAPVAAILARLGASPAEARVRIAELLRGFSAGPASAP